MKTIKRNGYFVSIGMVLGFLGFMISFILADIYQSGLLTLVAMAFVIGMLGLYSFWLLDDNND